MTFRNDGERELLPDVLAPAGMEVIERENLDAVAAKTIAEVVGPPEPGIARDEGYHQFS